jgi:predicted RNase H-like nuclease (RuvC/YqgF family)
MALTDVVYKPRLENGGTKEEVAYCQRDCPSCEKSQGSDKGLVIYQCKLKEGGEFETQPGGLCRGYIHNMQETLCAYYEELSSFRTLVPALKKDNENLQAAGVRDRGRAVRLQTLLDEALKGRDQLFEQAQKYQNARDEMWQKLKKEQGAAKKVESLQRRLDEAKSELRTAQEKMAAQMETFALLQDELEQLRVAEAVDRELVDAVTTPDGDGEKVADSE